MAAADGAAQGGAVGRGRVERRGRPKGGAGLGLPRVGRRGVLENLLLEVGLAAAAHLGVVGQAAHLAELLHLPPHRLGGLAPEDARPTVPQLLVVLDARHLHELRGGLVGVGERHLGRLGHSRGVEGALEGPALWLGCIERE